MNEDKSSLKITVIVITGPIVSPTDSAYYRPRSKRVGMAARLRRDFASKCHVTYRTKY